MSDVHDGMVAVAAGQSAYIAQWTTALRAASIPYALAKCQHKDPDAPNERLEIWVDEEEAERAQGYAGYQYQGQIADLVRWSNRSL